MEKVTELQFSLQRVITEKQAGTRPACLLSSASTSSEPSVTSPVLVILI